MLSAISFTGFDVLTMLILWVLDFYYVYEAASAFLIASKAILGGIAICTLIFRTLKSVITLELSHKWFPVTIRIA
ncbi:hypothetical protein C9426_29435 [Serratia sp. S1B]|nr:hypothetical protein C9426_29435 [Serratia sp. S1B]